MLKAMPYDLLTEWRAYAQLEPFDEERQDLRIASVNQTLWNIHRDTKRHPAPFPLSDFVLPFGDATKAGKARRQQSWKEQKFIGKMIAASFGATIVKMPKAA